MSVPFDVDCLFVERHRAEHRSRTEKAGRARVRYGYLPNARPVRQAILVPSSHNTQCWRFQIAEKSISSALDLDRRCPVVDPDDHHVFVSLGCAAENMVHAPLATGLHADRRFDPSDDGMIAVNLEVTRQRITLLFQAISERQYTRGDYDAPGDFTAELRQLEQAGT